MKLHNILKEEMGVLGMDKIRKNFFNLIKKLGLPMKDYDIAQGSQGSTVIIMKNRKPIATLPISKAMDINYLTDMLEKPVNMVQKMAERE